MSGPPSFQQNLVNILGENVSLTPTGLAPSETTIVEFDRYYVPPDLSGNDAVLLKNTMRQLFENKLKKVVNTDSGEELDETTVKAFPPCGEDEKTMVLKSLIHRKAVLEQQLFNIGIKTPEEIRASLNEMAKTKRDQSLQGQDSLLARQYLTHYLKLKRFINAYNEQQYCIYLEDLSYGDIQKDLTDDMVKELLKQFVFFVLQSHHPLDDYKKTDPTAPAFVSRLQRKPLKEKFTGFMETYEKNKLPIPAAIAAVLDATELSPGAMEEEIKRRVANCKSDILKYIQGILPDSDPFWKRVKDKTNVDSVLDALLQYIKDLLKEIQLLETEKATLEGKLKACEQTNQVLENQKNILSKLVRDLQDQLTKEQGKDSQLKTLQQERDAAVNELAARQASIAAEKQEYENRIRACEAKVTQMKQAEEAFQGEIEGLQRENKRLNDLLTKATTDIQALQLELKAEKAKVQEQTTARAAAESAVQTAKQTLADKIQELADAQAAVAAHDKTIKAKEADAAAAQRLLEEKENEIAKIRTEIQGKSEESRLLNVDLTAARSTINSLNEQIRALQNEAAESKTADDAHVAELKTLRDELAKEMNKAKDLELQVKACKDEVTGLRGSVSGSSAEVNKLTSQLRLAEDQRAAAVSERDNLAGQIKTLQSQLADSQEESKAQTALVAERDTTLESKEEELTDAKTNAATQRKRAEEAEAKVEEVEAEKDALAVSMSEQVKSVQESLGSKYQEELQRAKQSFDEALAGQQGESDAELAKVKSAHELLRQVVLAVASETDPRAKVAELGDVPERASLDTIVNRLTAAATKHAAPAPLAALAEQKKATDSAMQCYFSLLLSFLWRSNFPQTITNSTVDPEYPKEKQVLSILSSVFTNGPDPTNTTGTKHLGGVYDGLYKKLEAKGNKTTLMKEYFRVIQTLAKAIEGNVAKPIEFIEIKGDSRKKAEEEAKYKEYTRLFISQIDSLTELYKGKHVLKEAQAKPSTKFQNQALATILSTMNTEEEREAYLREHKLTDPKEEAEVEKEVDLVDFLTSYMIKHQPGIPNTIFTRRIVIDGPNVKVGETGNVNYAVLFYCFLMVLRDYLNSIENTGDQCRLPKFLETSSK